MGQEECEIENCIQEKNKRNGDANMKRSRRILSLVLALIMICSTMGVMTFAVDEDDQLYAWCTNCEKQVYFNYYCYENCLERIIECPIHEGAHDAEEWHSGYHYICTGKKCGNIICPSKRITYVCLI